MRIWFIPPAYLDNKRLNAAHHEIHTCLSCIRSGTRWGSMTDPFVHSIHYLKKNHDDLVQEIVTRQGDTQFFDLTTLLDTHPSPFEGPRNDEEQSVEFIPTTAQIKKDIHDLRNKWEAEWYYYGWGSTLLEDLECAYDIPMGRGSLDAQNRRDTIKRTIKNFSLWFKAFQKVWPKTTLSERVQAFVRGRIDGHGFCTELVWDNYIGAREIKQEHEEILDVLVRSMKELRRTQGRRFQLPGGPTPATIAMLADEMRQAFPAVLDGVTDVDIVDGMRPERREHLLQARPTRPPRAPRIPDAELRTQIRDLNGQPIPTLEEEMQMFVEAPIRRVDRLANQGLIMPQFPEPEIEQRHNRRPRLYRDGIPHRTRTPDEALREMDAREWNRILTPEVVAQATRDALAVVNQWPHFDHPNAQPDPNPPTPPPAVRRRRRFIRR